MAQMTESPLCWWSLLLATLPPLHLLIQVPVYDINQGPQTQGPGGMLYCLQMVHTQLTSSLCLLHTPHTDKTWKINV